MIGLLQRVAGASVTIGGETVADIGRGLLVLVAVRREDTRRDAERLAARHPEGPLPDSGTLIRDPAPLDWAPRLAHVRSPAGEPNQCHQGTC